MATKTKKASVEAECGACDATGIYKGMCEQKEGLGVVCLKCDGSGKVTIEYTPFVSRKRRGDITTVKQSQGTFIGTGVGPVGGGITYDEFWAGKKP